jgi:hypothetical protein
MEFLNGSIKVGLRRDNAPSWRDNAMSRRDNAPSWRDDALSRRDKDTKKSLDRNADVLFGISTS